MRSKTSTSKFIEYTSAVALAFGLFYGLFLIIKNIFLTSVIQESEVQITAVLLATGLLGNVLGFVLEKIVKEFIEQNLSGKIKQAIDENIEQTNILVKEEKDRVDLEEIQSSNALNTVIVPVQNSSSRVESDKVYTCPSSYTFKSGLDYIAFYKGKNVIGYGKIISNYNEVINGEKKFKIDSFISTNIPHNRPGAFVQNKMYCNIDRLKNANSTDDIRTFAL